MLAGEHGDYLFQIRPDIFPEGCLTLVELELWGLYYEWKNKAFNARVGKNG